MSSTADYSLLDSKDGIFFAEPLYPAASGNSKEYPGNRRQNLQGSPPQGFVLTRTSGNALVAVNEAATEDQTLISVTVPHGKGARDSILVKCPYSDMLISIIVPDGIGPGQVFFVRATDVIRTTQSTLPGDNNDPVSSDLLLCDELKHAAEHELEQRHFG